MDPFVQVYNDAQNQLSTTVKYLEQYQRDPSANHLLDLNNATQELTETIHDLSQSVGAAKSRPNSFGLTDHEINDRISKIGLLNSRLSDIQESIPAVKQSSTASKAALFQENEAEDDSLEPSGGNFLHEGILQEQDTVLDSVYTTVNSLREQANVMSRELEDQSYLIEDFDRQADTTGDKLKRGLKRVDWVVRNNKETLSSCCITVLILVLVILLVLVIII
jgi:t-SNARE syntaxin family protein